MNALPLMLACCSLGTPTFMETLFLGLFILGGLLATVLFFGSAAFLVIWLLVKCAQSIGKAARAPAVRPKPARPAAPPQYPRPRSTTDTVTPTHAALAALWVAEAETEQSRAAGLARTALLLTAAGAPAPMVVEAHRASSSRLQSAQACLAAAGRSSLPPGARSLLATAPLPDRGGLVRALVADLLQSGCLLAEFRADVAEVRASSCENPKAQAVLERMVVNDRAWAKWAWGTLAWLLARDARATAAAIDEAGAELRTVRPAGTAAAIKDLIKRADPTLLLKGGHLPEASWALMWPSRLRATASKLAQTRGAMKVESSA